MPLQLCSSVLHKTEVGPSLARFRISSSRPITFSRGNPRSGPSLGFTTVLPINKSSPEKMRCVQKSGRHVTQCVRNDSRRVTWTERLSPRRQTGASCTGVFALTWCYWESSLSPGSLFCGEARNRGRGLSCRLSFISFTDPPGPLTMTSGSSVRGPNHTGRVAYCGHVPGAEASLAATQRPVTCIRTTGILVQTCVCLAVWTRAICSLWCTSDVGTFAATQRFNRDASRAPGMTSLASKAA